MEMLFAFARRERLGFITLEVRESNAPAIAFMKRLASALQGAADATMPTRQRMPC